MNMNRTRAPSMAFVLSLAAVLVASTASRGTAQSVTYSGRAYGAQVKLVNPQPNILIFSDTGNLPPSGGSLSATLLTIALGNTLSSTTISASTQGSAGVATSTAHQENVLAFSGQPAQVTAAIVESRSRATCGGVTGSSVVTSLTFGGQAVTVSGQPNQTVTILNVATLIINEQIVASATDITVNALHLLLGTGEEVILSSSHSDVACVVPTRSSTWGRIKAIYR